MSPALLKVTTNLKPAFWVHDSKLPSSAVTVCGAALSIQSHSTVSPTLTLTLLGSKRPTVFGSGLSLTTWVPVPLVLPPVWLQPLLLEVPLLPPQAVKTSALPAATSAI